MKTAEQLVIDYDLQKKRKTLRGWEASFGVKIDINDFDHFKKNKKYYLELKKLTEIRNNLLKSEILEQLNI